MRSNFLYKTDQIHLKHYICYSNHARGSFYCLKEEMRRFSLLVVLVSCSSVFCERISFQEPEERLVQKVITECVESKSRLDCFLNKATKALERSINFDIPLFDGIKLTRNEESVEVETAPRTLSSFTKFMRALGNFLRTHTVSLDLTEEEAEEGEEAREFRRGGGGGGGGGGKKGMRREKKYIQYALMVLLGIFGLTGPLVMKTLAVMAAKALIASKVALIIVGSVALKKIFEKDHEQPAVKVHTINTDDGHDRIYNSNLQSPYWLYEPYVKPQ